MFLEFDPANESRQSGNSAAYVEASADGFMRRRLTGQSSPVWHSSEAASDDNATATAATDGAFDHPTSANGILSNNSKTARMPYFDPNSPVRVSRILLLVFFVFF